MTVGWTQQYLSIIYLEQLLKVRVHWLQVSNIVECVQSTGRTTTGHNHAPRARDYTLSDMIGGLTIALQSRVSSSSSKHFNAQLSRLRHTRDRGNNHEPIGLVPRSPHSLGTSDATLDRELGHAPSLNRSWRRPRVMGTACTHACMHTRTHTLARAHS
jgi:hypothetical protein